MQLTASYWPYTCSCQFLGTTMRIYMAYHNPCRECNFAYAEDVHIHGTTFKHVCALANPFQITSPYHCCHDSSKLLLGI